MDGQDFLDSVTLQGLLSDLWADYQAGDQQSLAEYYALMRMLHAQDYAKETIESLNKCLVERRKELSDLMNDYQELIHKYEEVQNALCSRYRDDKKAR